tara:strand:+ start:717 stop:1322 length:606 start_codon:yes stop_codon:yes gene_type:complete
MGSLIAQGAEAKLVREGDVLVKERISKGYRDKELDISIRRSRTKREAKVLCRLKDEGIPAPALVDVEEFVLRMEWIEGNLLRDYLDEVGEDEAMRLFKEVGVLVGRLHDLNIVHGDLTTSNLILRKGVVHLLDFGLSVFSCKVEDKAVDLHLFRQALESRHSLLFEKGFQSFLFGYRVKDRDSVLERLEKVEGRGRNKSKG